MSTLEECFALEVVRLDSTGIAGLDAVITFGCADHDPHVGSDSSLPLLAFDGSRDSAFNPKGRVCFTNNAETPAVLRGRSFAWAPSEIINEVRPRHDETVLATIDGVPIWTVQTSRAPRSFRCGMPFPALEPGQGFCDYLDERRFPSIVPLIQFVREITGEHNWHVPMRAALMFDDPNLHWPSYGCLHFDKLAASAARHGYHAAIATVPFDSWYSHPAAVRAFHHNPDRISLLVHGNNHTYAELLGQRGRQACASYLGQALGRIRVLERNSGLSVSRVMAAPHGACSEDMLTAMVDVGFEAAAISATSLRYYNPSRPWVRPLGLAVTEHIGGLPVIPRFRITSDCEARVLIAAYLRQPILPVGHHWDVADGLGLLESTAAIVNSLEGVQWCDLRDRCTISLRDEVPRRRIVPEVVLPLRRGAGAARHSTLARREGLVGWDRG